MPELPEVETIVRQLKPSLIGQIILDQLVIDQKLGHLIDLPIQGSRIKDLNRVGKQILFTLEDGPIKHLAVHLRMTGSLLWRSSEPPASGSDVMSQSIVSLSTKTAGDFNSSEMLIKHQTPNAKHHRWALNLERGTMIFSDIRRFGTVTPCKSLDELLKGAVDPLNPEFSTSFLKSACLSTARPIKVMLLDQSKIVGIGNIYASEILFKCQIDPKRPSNSLTDIEVDRLHSATREILLKAIKHNGTTFSDYRDSNGEKGDFQNLLAVYDREGLECKRCKQEVLRCTQAQRSTFFCSRCQI